jgi:hypothetical protein
MIRDDERTTAQGLFNYARSFWQSAVALERSNLKEVTHPNAPSQCFCVRPSSYT